MFTFLSRFRRQTAVLTTLALVASVLVAVPVSAADDPPMADYKATFDACMGVPSSGFEDVPSSHMNAGDIDCIAYYAITKGTGDGSTYSPFMSVTREHMALFLIRLAGLVGIDVPPAGDSSFSDIGDLSEESQAAISQLEQLEITRGTSDTTYSPADSVRRDHMALFISSLMDKMEVIEVDGASYGNRPEDVKVVKGVTADLTATPPVEGVDAIEVGSPYTDLGSTTKAAYDAITDLYELGVVSGISDTAYGPSALITRAAMAEFMAAVLDHSNARPEGLSAQAVKSSEFGPLDAVVVVSYRGERFAPVEDMTINYFYTGMLSSTDNDGGATIDDEAGTCTPADCRGDDDVTDTDGNITIEQSVDAGNEIVQYAWVGDDDFDSDEVTHVSVTLTAMTDAANIAIESDINKNADANTVDVDVTDSVTFTVQLKDATDTAADRADVMKSGVSISVTHTRHIDSGDGAGGDPDGNYSADEVVSRSTATVKTDDSGQATFTVEAPSTDPDENDHNVQDTITFDGPGDNVDRMVIWRDDDHGTANKLTVDVPEYALIYLDDGTAVVDGEVTVTLYDMYGNTAGTGLRVIVDIDGTAQDAERVNSRGQAKFSQDEIASNNNASLTTDVTSVHNKDTPNTNLIGSGITDVTTNPSIPVVAAASDDEPAADVIVTKLLKDENEFIGSVSGGSALLYSYDSDDTYIDGSGAIIDMAKFESELEKRDLADTTADVDVVVYNDDGSSIFRISSAT